VHDTIGWKRQFDDPMPSGAVPGGARNTKLQISKLVLCEFRQRFRRNLIFASGTVRQRHQNSPPEAPATWNNASLNRLTDRASTPGMSDFDATDSFLEFSFPNFSQWLRRQA
jgi:hypothetical protein